MEVPQIDLDFIMSGHVVDKPLYLTLFIGLMLLHIAMAKFELVKTMALIGAIGLVFVGIVTFQTEQNISSKLQSERGRVTAYLQTLTTEELNLYRNDLSINALSRALARHQIILRKRETNQ